MFCSKENSSVFANWLGIKKPVIKRSSKVVTHKIKMSEVPMSTQTHKKQASCVTFMSPKSKKHIFGLSRPINSDMLEEKPKRGQYTSAKKTRP